jgi:predicted ribosomally synthesized peptide with SipW-like signal peptide
MKKNIFSLMIIAAAAAVIIGGTTAYFSDTEKSEGNTFTAGSIDLKIASDCTYNGVSSDECGDWDLKDLAGGPAVAGDRFFNFKDVKPGDYGDNLISFEVQTNEAWMCLDLDVTKNSNLGKYLNIFWWIDANSNGVYDAGETILYGGPRTLNGWLSIVNVGAGATGRLPLTFADSKINWKTHPGGSTPNTTPIPAGLEQHLGVGWCFGEITLDANATRGFTCDGSGENNDAQNAEVMADLNFYVEQHRNNPNFVCPERRQS